MLIAAGKQSLITICIVCMVLYCLWTQGWQGVAKSVFCHWFLPVKTGWQKPLVAKSGKKWQKLQ